MAKLILVIAVFAVVYLIVRAGRNKSEGAPPSDTREEDMVRCQVCGVHLPKSEALASRGDFYCTEEHLRISRGNRD